MDSHSHSGLHCCFTHCWATHEDDDEGAEDSADTDHPGHPQEEDDPKNVLDTRQVHSHQSAQLWSLTIEEEHRSGQMLLNMSI